MIDILLFALTTLVADPGAPACVPDRTVAQGIQSPDSAVAECAVEDKPISPVQDELLEIAFAAASAIPYEPHVKDRCRAQEAVVATCIQLDLPQRAERYIDEIHNWRRGTAYANLASYCARRGDRSQAERHLRRAQIVADATDDWRRDHIRASMATTRALLQSDVNAAAGGDLQWTSLGAATVSSALGVDENHLDEYLSAFDAGVASNNFELLRNALEGAACLFDRFYGDTNRRDAIESKIRSAWSKLPMRIRIDLLMTMSRCALERADQAKALELVNDACGMMKSVGWAPEEHVALMANLAELRHRAGDAAAARAQADAAMALFDEQRGKMFDIDRAGALRSVAEAYQVMGDSAAALAIYARAVREGIENPNSRPRAEDLAATCSSMALHAVEPGAALLDSIKTTLKELDHPW